jgi:ribosome-associated translation inhibitor RaiA
MSAANAREHATRAVQAADTNEKLTQLAKAVYAIAGAIEELERQINHVRTRIKPRGAGY